ncbi:unnamed protein product [Blepharisma stoltei]|uniref:Diacylglycerol kinase n=1 Tax=Blepharisma stoltei TaxID=1481888 RepID=A0AAU9I7F5_9CILI|nr:unnamed protein product [Blepharisma stoltei]
MPKDGDKLEDSIRDELTQPCLETSIVLFANTSSGSTKAREYINLNSELHSIATKNGTVDLYIYHLNDENSKRNGALRCLFLLEKVERLKVMAAGGDGTLIYVMETLLSFNVNISSIDFGILPFGTGNDLASMLGWGRDPKSPIVGKHFTGLKNSIENWLDAVPMHLDMWNIEIDVQEDGYLEKIAKQPKGFTRETMKNPQGEDIKCYKRLMTNYFSIGLDARIGVGFDKKRTKNKHKNRMIYCWEGFKKIFCLPSPKVKKITTSLIEEDSKHIFNNLDGPQNLPPDTTVLLALNSRTYGGGDHFVWDKAKYKGNKLWNVQSPRDGLLEFMIYRGSLGLGLEQIFTGRAHKLHQSQGPFEINFNDKNNENNRIYMQIDGEYFYAIKPKQVRISLSEISVTRQISVLVNSKIIKNVK